MPDHQAENTALGQEILNEHLKVLLKRYRGGDITAAEMTVALRTIQAMEIQMRATPGNPLGQLKGALTDSLPFAGSGSDTYQ